MKPLWFILSIALPIGAGAQTQALNTTNIELCDGQYIQHRVFQVVPGARYAGQALGNYYRTYSAGAGRNTPNHVEINFSQITSVTVRDSKGQLLETFRDTPIVDDGHRFNNQKGAFTAATDFVVVEVAGTCLSWDGVSGARPALKLGPASYTLAIEGPPL